MPHAAHRTALAQFLPRFYPVFTLFRRVKSRVYPKFTPIPRFFPHQAFYPNFSTYAPFLPQFYPRGKMGLFLLVEGVRIDVKQAQNSREKPFRGVLGKGTLIQEKIAKATFQNQFCNLNYKRKAY